MFIVQTQIFINQVPSTAFPTRAYEFGLTFVNEIEANDSWADFTNQCKITLPKHYSYTDTTGTKIINPGNPAANIGGFSANSPLFLRGDEVTVILGYKYKVKGQDFIDTATVFTGFISKVSSKKPFVLECEDNMWKLKQIPAPNKTFSAKSYTLESMLAEMLSGTPFTVNGVASTDLPLGDFRSVNYSVMDVLTTLRKDAHTEAYFKGNELRIGYQVVYMDQGDTYNFEFQNNIIEDDLDYSRKDDVVLSAVAYSINTINGSGLTKDGHQKTKKQRLEVFVAFKNGDFTSIITKDGSKPNYPANITGERREFPFLNVTDPAVLIERAKALLSKYYYTGFKGKFTTFGIPFVRQGDNAVIIDPILPERNGTYKIKSVHYKLSVDGGLRQEVQLDYKVK